MWVTIILIAILNILYLLARYKQTYAGGMTKKVTITHYAMSTVALTVYTYADALPIWSSTYHPLIATIITVVFGAFAAFVADPEVTPADDKRLQLPA